MYIFNLYSKIKKKKFFNRLENKYKLCNNNKLQCYHDQLS